MASFVIRMKFHKKKFLTTVSAVALVLAVGACSSNGDDDGNTAERDTALEDLKAAQAKVGSLTEELATANSNLGIATGRVMDLETSIGEVMDPAADSLRGMLAQANMDLDGANIALQMAMDNSVDEMEIDRLTLAVTAAEGMRNNYMTMLTAANLELDAANLELDGDADTDTEGLRDAVTRLELALAKIEMETEAGRNAMDLANRIARAGMVLASIGPNPGGISPNLMPTGVTGVTAERDADDVVTVDLNVNGDLDDDYADNETTAGSGDWNSVTMTKTNAADDTTDTVVVYTDIAAPADVDFGTEYDSMTNFLSDTNVDKARADNFPTGPSQSVIYNTDSGNPLSFRGTFDDVPGVFTCAMGPCTLTTDPKGVLEGSAGNETWGFTPDAPNSATVKKPAEAYTYFGWWLNKPVKAADSHMVDVFAGGVGGNEATIDAAIVGTAKYVGPAAGKYATKTFTAGVQTDAAVGHFTAAASLTAKFGDDSGMLGTGISGTVSNFVLDDTNSVPWKVTLELAPYIAANFTGTTEVDFGGGATASGDPTNAAGVGAWQGSFYNADATDDTNAPGTVVGTFGAADQNASVLGAFGATKQ